MSNIETTDGSPNYTHYDGKRSITITGDLDSKIITSTKLTNKIKDAFNGNEYSDIEFIYGGESEETNKSVQDLIRIIHIGHIGNFLFTHFII